MVRRGANQSWSKFRKSYVRELYAASGINHFSIQSPYAERDAFNSPVKDSIIRPEPGQSDDEGRRKAKRKR